MKPWIVCTIVVFLFASVAHARRCSLSSSKIRNLLQDIKKGSVNPSSGIAIPLVAPSQYNDEDPLELCDESVEYLRGIKDKKVAFVTIFGNARTGKSTLLNHLLGIKKGFDVGSDVQSVTTGIWFWSVPLIREGSYLLLMDTEGLGRAGPRYDSAVTLLASVLSSNIVFLDSSSIRYDDVRYLHSLIGFIESVASHFNEGSTHTLSYPPLTWVVNKYCYNEIADKKVSLLSLMLCLFWLII